MAVAAAMAALGLAALVALPGVQEPDPAEPREVVPGAETLHVSLHKTAEHERLSPGDRVEYTIGVRNSGARAVTGAEIVHHLPPTMRYVTGTRGAEVDGGRVVWSRPLEAGERTSFTVTGELTALPEGAGRPVATACLRSGADGVLVSCASQEHEVRRSLLPLWAGVTAAVVGLLALAGGGAVFYLRTRRPRPAPAPSGAPDPDPEPVPDGDTRPGATVHRLDAHRQGVSG
ncbi:hypothetical protein [Nocardiopsis sp. CC223A]|uniref:hypothetical protein n=1 Tax=Nocardiopsis sp. CC223A TaxID=3044051 RepID=UPI00278C2A25|nr:hypothetical protein [Nocardiopsis sp. CC223A]